MKKIKLTKLISELKLEYDLFLTCASYETRCLSVINHIPKNIKNIIIFNNLEFKDHNADNINAMRDIFKNIEIVETKTEDPVFTTDTMLLILEKYSESNNILIDITTFTHEALLIIIWILKEMELLPRVTFLYANATEYSVGEDVERKWLSKGVIDIRSVLGYPGNILPSRKNHLIVLTGYEYERAKKIIDILQPNSLALGYGKASNIKTEKNKKAESHFHELLKTSTVGNILNNESFDIACNDPEKTSQKIIEHLNNHEKDNIILAPMNNKMSTIGCAIAAFKNPKIQICYAQPFQYNIQNYSKPGDECYIFSIPTISKASD